MSAIEAVFLGALGRDAELKTSKAGKPYARLNMRVGDGDAAQWINCMVCDPEAIKVADKLVKGVPVYVEGSLKLNEWTAADGTKRTGLSVMSWHCRLSEIGRHKARRDTYASPISSPARRMPDTDKAISAFVENQGNGFDSDGGCFHDDKIPFSAEAR